MRDPVVIKRLRERGANFSNIDEVIIYEGIEQKPRFLDKPPKRMMMMRDQNMQIYGCYNEFIIAYNSILSEIDIEQGTIDMRGNIRFCDPEVYAVLKTLVNQGICGVEERATACFDLFRDIIIAPGDYLSVKGVYDILYNYTPTGYYCKELLAAIRRCLFNEDLPVLHWYRIADCLGYYQMALKLGADVIRQNCQEEKDVEKFLQEPYKQAKDDKEFMAEVYKKAVNKWMIAMLYILKDTHPMVLQPGADGGGFKCP